jgi:hypothetical protein
MQKPLSFYQPTMQIPDTTSGFDINNLGNLNDPFGMLQNSQIQPDMSFLQSPNFNPNPVAKKPSNNLKQQQLGNMLLALSDIYGGRNPNPGMMQRSQMMREQKERAERQAKQEQFMSIPKQVSRSSYDNNQEYYRAIGQKYIDEGYLDQGLKFLEIGKPTTPKDFTSTILSQRDKVEKQYSPVKDNVLNFQKLDTALNSDSGTGAYTALVFYLKNLDGSVVKSEEVNTFQEMQGFLKNIEQKYEKTKGEGMTDEVKAQLRNISAQATALTVKGYNDYLAGSKNTYNALGLNPNLIYDGYLIDTSGINLGQVDPSYFEEEIQFTEKK